MTAPVFTFHPVPVTVAVPAAIPVPVDPATVSTPVLLDENVPPVQPAGAESVVVPLTGTPVGVAVTAYPVGHGGITVSVPEHVAVPLSQLSA